MRVLGQALLGVGLAVAVFGVLLLEDLVGLAENRTGLDTFGAFLAGLGYTALFAAPGILVALVGWGLVRRERPATEERPPPNWGLMVLFGAVALAVWGGVALSISTTHRAHAGRAEPLKPPSLAQQRADQAAAEAQLAADRAGHPVPAVELRRTERKLEARLRKQNPGSSATARCRRGWEWNVSCDIELTGPNGIPAGSTMQGEYLPQSRWVIFDTPLPGAQP